MLCPLDTCAWGRQHVQARIYRAQHSQAMCVYSCSHFASLQIRHVIAEQERGTISGLLHNAQHAIQAGSISSGALYPCAHASSTTSDPLSRTLDLHAGWHIFTLTCTGHLQYYSSGMYNPALHAKPNFSRSRKVCAPYRAVLFSRDATPGNFKCLVGGIAFQTFTIPPFQ